jgi:cyanophycinase
VLASRFGDPGVLGRPILLLADSQLLFWNVDGSPLLHGVPQALDVEATAVNAAYLGASNGDEPAFYALFTAAMHAIGIANCCHVTAKPDEAQRAFLARAHIILLAGGDTWNGWQAFQAAGIVDVIRARYRSGAFLIGVSAGAIQLGTLGWRESDGEDVAVFETFALVPYAVSAHDEKSDWASLRSLVCTRVGACRGLGLPTGGGAFVHADGSIHPIRHPVYECWCSEQRVEHALLTPRHSGSVAVEWTVE